MRPTDITRLRRADSFVAPGGGGAAARMRGGERRRSAGYCSIVIGDDPERPVRENEPSIFNSL